MSGAGPFSFLDRSRTVAGPGFSRWMVPPAALCVHLCIGQAYAFSVFNLPMTRLLGVGASAPGATLNPVLPIVALGAGLLWGGMARAFGRLPPSILAHALFDWAVIMMFPLWGAR